MLRRLLERPCTLALLVGSQLAVMMYLSLGGFRSLSALFGREQGPTFDYSHPRDVYSNLSHLPGAPGAAGAPAQALPYCPERSPFLVGPVSVSFSPVPSLAEIVERNPRVESGGRYRPAGCEPRSRTAIIVPHRAREHHLRLLLYHLHPFLQRQQLAYGIYVIHQAGNGTFNRAKLLNVGVREALRDEEWDCLFLHDVDLLPENDHNLYVCDPRGPRHVAVAMNKFGYSLPYPQYFGGVSALTPDQYLKMNGFPNEYWGWGGEDDDIATRVRLAGMKISRPPTSVGHYKMVKHRGDKGNEENPHSSPGTRDRKGWVLTQEEDCECQHPLNNNEHPLYNPGSRPERLVRLLWNACWSSPSNMDRWVCSAWKRLGKQDRMLSSRLLPANTPRHRLSMAKDATLRPFGELSSAACPTHSKRRSPGAGSGLPTPQRA